MTDGCFICGYDIMDWTGTIVFMPYPCLLVAHGKCWSKFQKAFKKKYGFKIKSEAKK